jgi:FMN-dependent NADH-azoreductase
MTRILRVDTSIRGKSSVTRRICDGVIDRLRAQDAAATVKLRDLSRGLPAVDAAWLDAVTTHEADRDDDQRSLTVLSDTLIAELQAADVIVIALPVYNFGVPATLKSWMDHVARQDRTFAQSADGAVGLLAGKRAMICYASDDTPSGSAQDFATPHLRHMLGFIGITDIEVISADLADACDGIAQAGPNMAIPQRAA